VALKSGFTEVVLDPSNVASGTKLDDWPKSKKEDEFFNHRAAPLDIDRSGELQLTTMG
jgi:hypothetical protein